MTRKMFAMLSAQETACAETALCGDHFTPEERTRIENEVRSNTHDPAYALDAPAPNSWADCSGNDFLTCTNCGATA